MRFPPPLCLAMNTFPSVASIGGRIPSPPSQPAGNHAGVKLATARAVVKGMMKSGGAEQGGFLFYPVRNETN